MPSTQVPATLSTEEWADLWGCLNKSHKQIVFALELCDNQPLRLTDTGLAGCYLGFKTAVSGIDSPSLEVVVEGEEDDRRIFLARR
jgi:hypothetical protein